MNTAVARAARAAAAAALALGALAATADRARAAEAEAYAAALTYATPAVIAGQGDSLRFNNLDSIAQHDLVSDQPGLFSSPLIAGGQSAIVTGVGRLAAGTYAFHCSLHSWMHGELTIAAGGSGLPQLPPAGGGPAPQPGASPNPGDLLPHAPAQPLGASEWPFYGGGLAGSRDGGASAPSYNEVPALRPVWSFRSDDGDFTGTPVVADGVVVAVSGAGTVYSIDGASGRLLWQRRLAAAVNGSAAIANGRVFVPIASPGHPQVAALRLGDGALLWRSTIDTQKDADVYGSPVVWTLPMATARAPSTTQAPVRRRPRHRHRKRRSVRHKAARRRAPHRRRRAAAPQRAHAQPHPAAPRDSGETVFIGTSALFGELNDPSVRVRGSVVALDATSGAIRWKTYTVAAGHDGGAVWSTPAIDASSGRLFVGTGNAYHPPADSTTDSILALDARTGAIAAHLQATGGDVWNASGGGGPDYDFGASPNLFEGPHGEPLVGAGQKSGAYWALDRSTLHPVWTASVGAGTPVVGGIVGSTATDGQRIYGPDTTAGEIWALGTDGRLAWLSSDGGPLQFAAVSTGNGVVYNTDMSGTLTAREASTGAPLAKLPIGAPSWGGVALAGGSVFAVTGTQGSGGWVVAYRPAT